MSLFCSKFQSGEERSTWPIGIEVDRLLLCVVLFFLSEWVALAEGGIQRGLRNGAVEKVGGYSWVIWLWRRWRSKLRWEFINLLWWKLAQFTEPVTEAEPRTIWDWEDRGLQWLNKRGQQTDWGPISSFPETGVSHGAAKYMCGQCKVISVFRGEIGNPEVRCWMVNPGDAGTWKEGHLEPGVKSRS